MTLSIFFTTGSSAVKQSVALTQYYRVTFYSDFVCIKNE